MLSIFDRRPSGAKLYQFRIDPMAVELSSSLKSGTLKFGMSYSPPGVVVHIFRKGLPGKLSAELD